MPIKAGLKLLHGVGINDATYPVNPQIEGKRSMCPVFEMWHGLIRRSYSGEAKFPTYVGCSADVRWHRFSGFLSWFDSEDTHRPGYALDKDLLVPGNRVYGPETCMFVPPSINSLFTGARAGQTLPVGVYYKKDVKKFRAQCKDGTGGAQVYLGDYANLEDAVTVYWKFKYTVVEKALPELHPKVAQAVLRTLALRKLESENQVEDFRRSHGGTESAVYTRTSTG